MKESVSKNGRGRSNERALSAHHPPASAAPDTIQYNSPLHSIRSRGGRPIRGASDSHNDAMALQRTVGNRAVGALLNGGRAGRYQIGPVDDMYEREADRMAETVTQTPVSRIQRAPA